MKTPAALALLLFLGLALACAEAAKVKSSPTPSPSPNPDWRNELTAPKPGKFPALRPMQAFYRFGWEGVTAAEGSLGFSRPKMKPARLVLEGRTTGLARTLWRLDARAVELCDSETLRPVRVRQAERYRNRTALTAQEFTPSGVLRTKGGAPGDEPASFFAETPANRDQLKALTGKKAKPFQFPNLFTLQSALLFVRSQPLAQGDVIRIVIYQDNAPYLATFRVAGRERITVKAGTFPTIRMDLTLRWVNDDLVLKPHTNFKRATGWLSDDANRVPVKLEADVFVGSIWAELTALKMGK